MHRAGLISITLSTLALTSVLAQEKPKFVPVILDNSVKYRQDVCDLHQKYYSGEVDLRDSLREFEMHTLFDLYDETLFSLKDGVINQENPGIFVILMDELAKRAGFKWRDSFAVAYPADLEEGATWNDLLLWGVERFDVHVDWWIHSVDRLKQGVGFPDGFYDASYILVGFKAEKVSGKADLFNWLEPFSPELWWTILGTILISTVFYTLLEKLNPHSEEPPLSLSRSLFLSSLLFTQHFQFSPKSHSARIFSGSMAFWSLIVVATYTANLASFFVAQNTPEVQINSIDDALRANMPICVWEDTAQSTYVTQTYPQGNFVPKSSEQEALLAVKNGDCDLAIASLQSWDQYENDRSVNGDCDLAWIGRVIKFVDGGFATKNDAGVLCTSLIHDVINVHLVEMHADGFIEKAWADSYSKNQDLDCGQMSASESEADAARLSLEEMAGTFFLHFLAGGVSLVVALFAIFQSKRTMASAESPEDSDIDTGSVHSTNHKNVDSKVDISMVLSDLQQQIKQIRAEQLEQRFLLEDNQFGGKNESNPSTQF